LELPHPLFVLQLFPSVVSIAVIFSTIDVLSFSDFSSQLAIGAGATSFQVKESYKND
jgi:hypothetical protein